MIERCYTVLALTAVFASDCLLIITLAAISQFKIDSARCLVPLLSVHAWVDLDCNFIIFCLMRLISVHGRDMLG